VTIALETPPRLLRPLPKSLHGMTCTLCLKLRSRWCAGPADFSEVDSICSVCYLSLAPWVHENVQHVGWLIVETEKELGIQFERDTDGCLVQVEDSDRILMALATGERVGHLHQFSQSLRRELS
jgi:hypothetical protein